MNEVGTITILFHNGEKTEVTYDCVYSYEDFDLGKRMLGYSLDKALVIKVDPAQVASVEYH